MSSSNGRGDGEVRDAVDALLAFDPAQCESAALSVMAAQSLRLRGWLDAVDAAIAVQASVLASMDGAVDAATVLGCGGRRSRRDAEAVAARGSVCARMTGVAAALAGGAVSAGHVDAIAAASRDLDDGTTRRLIEHEETLLVAAGSMSPERFERECRDLARALSDDGGLSRHERLRGERNVRRWVDRHSGMCKTLLSLDPLADAMAWTAINAAIATARSADQRDDERTWDQLQADVVVDLLTGARAVGDERLPEVSVLIDVDTLRDGIRERSICETADGQPLPVGTIRRLCCDGFVIPIVLGTDGEVLDVGRLCRLATRAQRRALRAMYRTCAHPDCTVPFDACRIHHVIHWERGGLTDLANLLPLCETHHHSVHEGGWTLQLCPNRRTIWRTPEGIIYYDGNSTDRTRRALGPRSPSRRTETATDVAADLELALAAITSRAPP